MADSAPLITKYRPSGWGEMIGNDAAIATLKRVILAASSVPHAYLFTGPSGIGKTTAARIIAGEIQADVQEIDAASNSGIDAMRDLVEFSQHMSFTGSGRRLLIIDECHALSRPAWQAILKLLEEPPAHLFIALCTTELLKVPETIQTRCFHTVLRPISSAEMGDYLSVICELEEWTVNPDVFQLVVAAATGQPRKALTIMQSVHDAPSRDEAKRVIALVEASDAMIELLQHLISGKRSWKVVRPLLLRIEADAFEDASLIAGRYVAGALLNADDDKRAAGIWQLLDALLFPSETWDKRTSFITAIGRFMWGGG